MKRIILIIFILGHGLYLLTRSSIVKTTSKNVETSHINPYKMIDEGNGLLKEGDLVVRLNIEPSSEAIRQFNRTDKRYSHAGIVLFDEGTPFVYHIVNGCENPDEKLRKDSLTRFCDPRRNLAFGIYRYALTDTEIQNLKAIIHKWYKMGVKFDYRFDLATNDKMYCSEMVSKALTTATQNRITIETTKPTAIEAGFFSSYTHAPYRFVSKLKIVAIDNLYKRPYCHLIKEYNYKPGK
jgi:hypothetical protein